MTDTLGPPFGAPDLAEVKAWMRLEDDVDDVALAESLAAALASQSVLVNYPGGQFTADLRQAVMLRTARGLARRNSPDGLVGFSEFGTASIVRRDPDVYAQESPYLKVVVA